MDVYGIIGNPVGHSLSPPMHEAAYAALDLDARYVAFEPDAAAIEAAIAGAATLGIRGLNVTIPFKESAMAHVRPDELAEAIGAINTIDFGTTPPTGYNTDAHGARRALERHGVRPGEADAVLVGAGGAGRAIAYMLADAGANVAIANRTERRAEDLAAALPGDASWLGLDEIPDRLEGATLLVNATSVGMESDESPVPADALHSGLTVMDAVYRPLETRLLRDAGARGATTIDGAWMLLYQGVEAFERWTDEAAPVEAMNRALRDRL